MLSLTEFALVAALLALLYPALVTRVARILGGADGWLRFRD